MRNLNQIIAQNMNAVLADRRWLHANPELSGKEKNTSIYIAGILRAIGLEPVENIGGYGVTALIEGQGSGKCVGLRADMDALPLDEKTGLDFSSKVPGVMHACGHDCHMAMLIGVARILFQLRDSFDGTVKLIFQPSEENPLASGAKRMIEDGVLLNPKVDAVFGQHMWPQYPSGKVAIRNGAMMAASDRFFITVKGKNSHGSAPEQGVDAIVAASHLITQLQSVVSRMISPLDCAVVTVGTISGGQRYNIIADEVKMEGTCRYLNPALRDLLPEYIEQIVKGVTEGMGAGYAFEYCKGYLPTVNSNDPYEAVCTAVKEVLGSDGLVIPEHSAMASEDFSYYCNEMPSAFFWLGCGDLTKHLPEFPLHHCSFNPEETALAVGVEVMVRAALNYLSNNI